VPRERRPIGHDGDGDLSATNPRERESMRKLTFATAFVAAALAACGETPTCEVERAYITWTGQATREMNAATERLQTTDPNNATRYAQATQHLAQVERRNVERWAAMAARATEADRTMGVTCMPNENLTRARRVGTDGL
jgi:hypothetical protein